MFLGSAFHVGERRNLTGNGRGIGSIHLEWQRYAFTSSSLQNLAVRTLHEARGGKIVRYFHYHLDAAAGHMRGLFLARRYTVWAASLAADNTYVLTIKGSVDAQWGHKPGTGLQAACHRHRREPQYPFKLMPITVPQLVSLFAIFAKELRTTLRDLPAAHFFTFAKAS